MKGIGLKAVIVLAYVQMLTVNALANILPINGKTTGALSDQYGNLFTPMGFTFSIWGVIYFLLLLFVLGIVFTPLGDFNKKIGQLFIANALLNSSWIFAWHYEQLFLSFCIMLGLLYTLVQLQIFFHNGVKGVKHYWMRMPFTVYFGWITVATIANATALLVGIGWEPYGAIAAIWTVALLCIGVAIAYTQLLYFKQPIYAVVILWAYWGIYFKHASKQGFDQQYEMVIVATVLGMAAMGYGAIRTGYIALKPNP